MNMVRNSVALGQSGDAPMEFWSIFNDSLVSGIPNPVVIIYGGGFLLLLWLMTR